MKPRSNIARRKRQQQTARDIHIPHSSWTRQPPTAANAALAPEDFWARLGL